MSLSVDAYDTSIDFITLWDQASLHNRQWYQLDGNMFFCSLAQNKFRVVHVIKRQPISHGYMPQWYSF
jgi:hypothetical protein